MFDIGAGLSAAGTAVAATAGQVALESQKADLEKQKLVLADQLAGARQEKQNVFTTSERLGTEQFTGGQGDLTRQTQKDVAKMEADARVAAAGAEAGGMIGAAQEHTKAVQLQLTSEENRASKPMMGPGGTLNLVNPMNGKATPVTGADGKPVVFNDPAQAAAIAEAVKSNQAQLNQLSIQRAQDLNAAKSAYETDIKENIPLLTDPAARAAATAAAAAKVQAVVDTYARQMAPLMGTIQGLSQQLVVKGGLAPTGNATGVDLNKYITPAAPAAITPPPTAGGATPGSLLNNSPADSP